MITDNRTEEQLKSHIFFYGGIDKCMSKFPGQKEKSYIFWACDFANIRNVSNIIDKRTDLKNVRETNYNTISNLRGNVKIIVVDDSHPYLIRR